MKELQAVLVEVETAFTCVLDLEADGLSDPTTRRALLGSAKAAVGRALVALQSLKLAPDVGERAWKLLAAAALLVHIREQLPVGLPLVPRVDGCEPTHAPNLPLN